MIERLAVPLAMLLMAIAVGLVLAVSSSHGSHLGALEAPQTTSAQAADGPPTCCTG